MYFQKILTPVVLVSLVIAQANPAAFAQPVAQPAQQPAAPTGLSNDSIIKMTKAGLSDDLIVSTINSSPGAYDTSADGMIALKGAGVSDRVVAAIVQKTNAPAQSAPAAQAALQAAGGKYLLPEGTDVFLTLDEEISSKTAQEGDLVALVLSEDIKVGDVVVVRAGAKAVGEVGNSEKSEMMGKGGALNIRLDYLKAGSQKVHLRGSKGSGGKDSPSIGLMMVCFICGVLHHGKDAKVAKGTAVHAYVSEDTSITPAM